MKRATLIHNPSAGDTELDADAIKSMLRQAGFQVRYLSRQRDWKKAVHEPTDLVVAAGGDGTVAVVALELAGSDMPMAILPLGTANNIARALGLVGDAREIVASWREDGTRPLDVGVVSSPWGEQRFLESAGGGLISQLIEAAREEDSSLRAMTGARGDRALALLESIASQATATRWEVELDGQDLSGEFIAVEAMNIRFVGPKVPFASDADPGDGLLDVVLLGEQERLTLLDYLRGRLHDSAAELPELPVRRGQHLRLRSHAGLPLHCGDTVVKAPSDASAEGVHDVLLKHAAIRLVG